MYCFNVNKCCKVRFIQENANWVKMGYDSKYVDVPDLQSNVDTDTETVLK